MKVAILNSCLFPIPAVKGGAVETLIESLIKGANRDSDLDITVFSLSDIEAQRKAEEAYPHIKFKWLNRPAYVDFIDRRLTSLLRLVKRNKSIWQKNFLWKYMTQSLIKKDLLREDYDALLIENALYLSDLFQSPQLKTKYQGKVFFHSHNTQFHHVNSPDTFAGIISISHFLKTNLNDRFSGQVPIHVVHNGVSLEPFKSPPSQETICALKARYHIPQDAPLIVFVGRIMPQKGILELLQAFQTIQNQDAHLLIVGSSSFGVKTKTAFEREVAHIVGQNKHIHLSGFVSNQDIAQYYTGADLIVLPSTWPEPLGLTMIEAQLSGTPLITTRQGGIPETTSENFSILLDTSDTLSQDLAKAIDLVLSNQEEWQNKAKQAQKIAFDRFDDQVYAQKVFHYIKESLSGTQND